MRPCVWIGLLVRTCFRGQQEGISPPHSAPTAKQFLKSDSCHAQNVVVLTNIIH